MGAMLQTEDETDPVPSDDEVVASFREFVDRKQVENERARGNAENWRDGYFTEPYCLMGAEDQWRWCSRPEGTSMIGSGEKQDAVPCRCSGCKQNGVVRIDH